MTAPADQLVEWVDEQGNVVKVVSRARVRAENLLHRSVFVIVRSVDGGAVLVHRRADWKDVWPSYWDLAVGGVVGVGEPWPDAARRELAEEVGVDVEAVHLVGRGGFTYRDRQVAEIAEVFEVGHDGPFRFADGEVTEVAWLPLVGLDGWLDGRQVCPDSLAGIVPLLRAAAGAA